MADLIEFEKMFKKNGWEKYLTNFYKWAIEGKDLNKLIEYIEKIESEEMKKMPTLELNDISITYNPEKEGYDIESSEDVDVSIKECKIPFHNDKTVGCKKSY